MGKVNQQQDPTRDPLRGQLQRQGETIINQEKTIRALRNQLDTFKSIIKAKEWNHGPEILFDSRQHKRRSNDGTWTRATPKRYWRWKDYAYADFDKWNKEQYSAQQLIRHINKIKFASQHIKRIVTVHPKAQPRGEAQKQPRGRVLPNTGATTSGRESSEPTYLGKKARKRIALIKRHREVFSKPAPWDSVIRGFANTSDGCPEEPSPGSVCLGKTCTSWHSDKPWAIAEGAHPETRPPPTVHSI